MNSTSRSGSILSKLSAIVGGAFADEGSDPAFGRVIVSNRPDLCDFQCNGAFAAAKVLRQAPPAIAEAVRKRLEGNDAFREVTVAGGYLNLKIADALLMDESGEGLDAIRAEEPMRIMIDYGGANVAKPLHVGHLRSAIIGESIKRICRALGHEVIGDVHLGDWGLQMGMIIHELSLRFPDLPYFDANYTGSYPATAPVTFDELDEIYPSASAKSKSDPAYLEAARQATGLLQDGRPGYRALWRSIVDISIAALRSDYAKLGVFFDLWYGESDVHDIIPGIIKRLTDEGFAYRSEGALVVDVAEAGDKSEIPPVMLQKADGAALYSTTDIATVAQRVAEFNPRLVLYVIDKRQALHLVQVFRCVHKTGIAPPAMELEHAGFGTMNGPDGKPFKTRAGGTMKLKDLIEMVTTRALERIDEARVATGLPEEERNDIAQKVGVATLKFADLSNTRIKDYVFDVDRFSSFEGRTGPYLLYTAVRAKSILRNAGESVVGPLIAPRDDVERNVLLLLALYRDRVLTAFTNRAPNEIADYAYEVAAAFARFYHEHHILSEEDPAVRASWLELVRRVLETLISALDLLGISVPERM